MKTDNIAITNMKFEFITSRHKASIITEVVSTSD